MVASAPILFTQILEKRNDYSQRKETAIAPSRRQIEIIDDVMAVSKKGQYITSEGLHRYAANLPEKNDLGFLNSIIENPKVVSKSPEEQDTLHRIQLLEIKADHLGKRLESLPEKDNPWWKDPDTLWLFALLWVLEKLLSRVVGDLITIAWHSIASKLGLSLPKNK